MDRLRARWRGFCEGLSEQAQSDPTQQAPQQPEQQDNVHPRGTILASETVPNVRVHADDGQHGEWPDTASSLPAEDTGAAAHMEYSDVEFEQTEEINQVLDNCTSVGGGGNNAEGGSFDMHRAESSRLGTGRQLFADSNCLEDSCPADFSKECSLEAQFNQVACETGLGNHGSECGSDASESIPAEFAHAGCRTPCGAAHATAAIGRGQRAGIGQNRIRVDVGGSCQEGGQPSCRSSLADLIEEAEIVVGSLGDIDAAVLEELSDTECLSPMRLSQQVLAMSCPLINIDDIIAELDDELSSDQVRIIKEFMQVVIFTALLLPFNGTVCDRMLSLFERLLTIVS